MLMLFFFLLKQTTEFRHALFPRKRDLCIQESNGNTQSYEKQANDGSQSMFF